MAEGTGQAAEVIEEVRVDGAQVVAAETVTAAAAGAAIITEQVAEVREELADHAEVSEERHEEILEGEAWLREKLESLSMSLSTLAALVTAFQSAVMARLMELEVKLLSQNASGAMSQSTQMQPESEGQPAAPVIDPAAVEAAEGEERREQQSREIPKRRRPRI